MEFILGLAETRGTDLIRYFTEAKWKTGHSFEDAGPHDDTIGLENSTHIVCSNGTLDVEVKAKVSESTEYAGSVG